MNFRPVRTLLVATAALSAAVTLTGCHSQSVKRSFSPLIGTWAIQGNLPAPDPAMPRFTRFHFHRSGRLDATYVAAGGALSGLMKTAPKVEGEEDAYTLVGDNGVRIIEGSRALDYRYDVRDGHLFLRARGAADSTVYNKVANTSADDDTSSDGGGNADGTATTNPDNGTTNQ